MRHRVAKCTGARGFPLSWAWPPRQSVLPRDRRQVWWGHSGRAALAIYPLRTTALWAPYRGSLQQIGAILPVSIWHEKPQMFFLRPSLQKILVLTDVVKNLVVCSLPTLNLRITGISGFLNCFLCNTEVYRSKMEHRLHDEKLPLVY